MAHGSGLAAPSQQRPIGLRQLVAEGYGEVAGRLTQEADPTPSNPFGALIIQELLGYQLSIQCLCAGHFFMCLPGDNEIRGGHGQKPERLLLVQVPHAGMLSKPWTTSLDIPAAKTDKPGVSQSVWIVPQGGLCAVEVLYNLVKVVPAHETDPLFSWSDSKNVIQPMVRPRILEKISSILAVDGTPRTFGHSFRIDGASFYMANKIDPEIVCMAGRWRSLAYETYIRSFEQVISSSGKFALRIADRVG